MGHIWLHVPCPSRVPNASETGEKSNHSQKRAGWLHSPCRHGGGFPNVSARGKQSELANKWAGRLHDPCRLGGRQRFRARGRIKIAPQLARVAEEPIRPRGSPTLQLGGGGGDQEWAKSGPGGYKAPAAYGFPNALERGAKSKVANKWTGWLHKPCRLGGPQRFSVGGRNRSHPQVGRGAT